MCKRICYNCQHEEHIVVPGIVGVSFICANDTCGKVLEFQYDAEAAPTNCLDPETYAKERSWCKSPEVED